MFHQYLLLPNSAEIVMIRLLASLVLRNTWLITTYSLLHTCSPVLPLQYALPTFSGRGNRSDIDQSEHRVQANRSDLTNQRSRIEGGGQRPGWRPEKWQAVSNWERNYKLQWPDDTTGIKPRVSGCQLNGFVYFQRTQILLMLQQLKTLRFVKLVKVHQAWFHALIEAS